MNIRLLLFFDFLWRQEMKTEKFLIIMLIVFSEITLIIAGIASTVFMIRGQYKDAHFCIFLIVFSFICILDSCFTAKKDDENMKEV